MGIVNSCEDIWVTASARSDRAFVPSIVTIERRRSVFDHGQYVVLSTFNASYDRFGVTVSSRICFEFIKVQYFVREVRPNDDIYIEIDVAQNAIVECRRKVNVAIPIAEGMVGLVKSKDAVPPI